MLRRLTTSGALLIGLLLWMGQPDAAWAQGAGALHGPKTLSGTTGSAACLVADARGLGTATFAIDGSGTWVAAFSGIVGGADPVALQVFEPDTGNGVTSVTSSGTWERSVAGYDFVRVCLTSHSSGTVRAWIRTAPGGGGGSGGGGSLNVENATIELVDGDMDPLTDDPNDALRVSIVSGAASGTTDTDDGSVAAGQSTVGLTLGLGYAYNGTNWVRMLGNATDGLLVNLGANNDVSQAGTWNINNITGTISLPTGAATAANQTTIIGHVDGIESALANVLTTANFNAAFGTAGSPDTQVLSIQGIAGGTAVPISASSLPLPTGAATSANQTTIIGHVDGLEGLLGTSNTNTGNAATALQLLDNAVGAFAPGTAATNSLAAGCVFNSMAPTATNGQQVALQCDENGQLKIAAAFSGSIALEDQSMDPITHDAADAMRAVLVDGSGAVVNLASDATFGTTTYTEATTTGPIVGGIRNDTLDPLANTNNEAAPLQVDANGALWTRFLDPCSGVAKQYYVINIATATTVDTGIDAGAGNHIYICAFNLVTGGANNVAFVEDDTDTCASPTAGLAGSTTTGWPFTHTNGGGIAMGAGTGTVMRTTTTNRSLCIVTSAATQVSGQIAYVIAP